MTVTVAAGNGTQQPGNNAVTTFSASGVVTPLTRGGAGTYNLVTPANTYTGTTSINAGTLYLSGANTYTGGTTVSGGALYGGGENWSSVENFTFDSCGGVNAVSYGGGPFRGVSAARTPIAPIPKGPVFYIITEGAGLGDSARTVPCSGKETVLSAVGAAGGISQVSGTKIWIARPAANNADKSAILPIDWEALSKRGINTTNYTLQPGDRLVFAADPLVMQSNLIGKKTAPIERIGGIIGLTTSTLRGVQNTPGAARLVKDLVEKNLITDDEQLKKFILDEIRGQENAKPVAKTKEKAKPGAGTVTPDGVALVLKVEEAAEKPKAADGSKAHAITIRGTLVLEAQPSAAPAVSAPHELAMRPLPAYRIEPPDVIQIEMLKLVPLARVSGAQPVTGQYLVGPDGTINLRNYGTVCVSGMTVSEAKAAVEKQLAKFLQAPEVSVDMIAYNSKVYYIITQGAGLGDSVRRLPSTGHETVLDAISQINGLSQVSDSKRIWIVRPSAADPAKGTILPVDWEAISRRGATATNYQIFPRDRLYIGGDRLMTQTNMLSKKTAPLERAMGIISLTASCVQSLNGTPGGVAAVQELLRKGVFDDNPELKRSVQEMLRLCEEESKKAAAKPPAKSKRLP
jgi:autotransporter-associated beta strand protein